MIVVCRLGWAAFRGACPCYSDDGKDEISADVVILCDGVNSLLAKQAVGFSYPSPKHMAVGIKQVFALPASVIADRVLGNSDDEGEAWLFAGSATDGKFGGGFAHTNKESVSLGIVAGIEAVESGDVSICQMMENLKQHPDVAALIRGGEMVEHSGHMVPEGGMNSIPELVADGVILAGDTAMMCINYGYMVRGMDYAVAAGQYAGQAAVQALDAGDTSKAGLQRYVDMLNGSFVMKDLESFRGLPAFLGQFSCMFNEYPALAGDVLNKMFIADGQPTGHLKNIVRPSLKKVGILNMVKDVRGALKNI